MQIVSTGDYDPELVKAARELSPEKLEWFRGVAQTSILFHRVMRVGGLGLKWVIPAYCAADAANSLATGGAGSAIAAGIVTLGSHYGGKALERLSSKELARNREVAGLLGGVALERQIASTPEIDLSSYTDPDVRNFVESTLRDDPLPILPSSE